MLMLLKIIDGYTYQVTPWMDKKIVNHVWKSLNLDVHPIKMNGTRYWVMANTPT